MLTWPCEASMQLATDLLWNLSDCIKISFFWKLESSWKTSKQDDGMPAAALDSPHFQFGRSLPNSRRITIRAQTPTRPIHMSEPPCCIPLSYSSSWSLDLQRFPGTVTSGWPLSPTSLVCISLQGSSPTLPSSSLHSHQQTRSSCAAHPPASPHTLDTASPAAECCTPA